MLISHFKLRLYEIKAFFINFLHIGYKVELILIL